MDMIHTNNVFLLDRRSVSLVEETYRIAARACYMEGGVEMATVTLKLRKGSPGQVW